MNKRKSPAFGTPFERGIAAVPPSKGGVEERDGGFI